jgi:phage protein D
VSAGYFAPEFRVEIDGSAVAADVSKNVMELSVTLAADAIDSLRLTLANPCPALRWTHTADEELFREGTAIKVFMGYTGALEPMFDGVLTGVSPTFPESGSPTLSVEGFSLLQRLQQKSDPITLQDATDGDMAKKIAEASGLSAKVDDPGITYPQLATAGEAHLSHLLERAREAGREVWVEGTTLHFALPRATGKPEYTLVWGRTRDAWTEGSLPLQSFTPTLDAQRPVNAVVVRGMDPLTGEAIVGKAEEGAEASRMGSQTGAQVRAAALGGPAPLGVVGEPVGSLPEAEARAKAIYNERAMEFIRGSGATLGLPKLRSGMVVTLDGVGPRFNGDYYVTRATHSIGGGGYRTHFEVRRNSVG